MKFYIKHQESYSRGELLLRTFFGPFYILIPHGIVLFFLSIGLMFVRLITFWACLLTGKFPKGLFDYQVKMIRYNLRLSARLMNVADGYPAFGLNGTDENTKFDHEYKEEVSRGRVLVRGLFGGLMLIPNIIALVVRFYATMFVSFVAFWVILFTGKLPIGMFNWITGTLRWAQRITCWTSFYTDDYPAFTGKPLPGEDMDIEDGFSDDEILDA